MHERKSFAQRADEFLNGKGFYIVLFVCIAVIGVSAWMLLFSQYSPLSGGGDGDYLDVMGPAAGSDKNIGGSEDINSTETDRDKDVNTGADTAPEHQTPEDKEPGSGALTVTPKPNEPEHTQPVTDGDEPEVNEPAAQLKPGDLAFIWPVNGDIAAPYSPAALVYDRTMGDWRTHDGLDIAAKLGSKVLAACDGTVEEVFADDMLGTTVVIDHGAGVRTVYSNMAAAPTVKAGDKVSMGDVIGSVGSTALAESGQVPHLHLSMTIEDESVDPADMLPKI